nr:hypothetical protein [uncultured Draconibacterium sp.]
MTGHSSYIILPSMKLIITYSSGKVNLKNLQELNQRFLTDKNYNPTFDVLMDFRDAVAIAFKMDVTEYLNFLKGNVSLPKKVRTGVVYSTLNFKFLLSIYKPLAALQKIDVGSFKSMTECLDWMAYAADEQKLINDAIESIKIELL